MAELLTTQQVQTLLRVDRTTIYRMVEGGKLPAIRVGKQWRFSQTVIEEWLRTQAAEIALPSQTRKTINSTSSLADALPIACVQLMQDAFADILGVMMVVTDMQGQPITAISNPCGFYETLTQDPDAISKCIHSWQEMAANPAIAPRFVPNEMGLLCARGLIRLESELKGMVVIGGIAPESWPPAPEYVNCLAETFGISAASIQASADEVYRLDKSAQDKALRSVQRIADIFSHLAGDRIALCAKQQTIVSLTTL